MRIYKYEDKIKHDSQALKPTHAATVLQIKTFILESRINNKQILFIQRRMGTNRLHSPWLFYIQQVLILLFIVIDHLIEEKIQFFLPNLPEPVLNIGVFHIVIDYDHTCLAWFH